MWDGEKRWEHRGGGGALRGVQREGVRTERVLRAEGEADKVQTSILYSRNMREVCKKQ